MEVIYETWIPTSFYEGLSSTFILSIHLLSLCTYWESIVAILSSMCIVPRLVDWCINLILLIFKLFVSSHSYELWRCPMHLCLLLYEGQAECHYAMFSLCETNKHLVKHCYSWIFCFYLFMLQHSCYVLLLELYLSCSCLEFLDPSYQCFYNNDDQVFDGACHLKNYSLFLSLTYSRTSRS